MTAELKSASIYTDFSGLAELRRQAQVDPDASLRKVAEQFEAIYMQMMLKSMREANFGNPLFDSNHSEFYQSMHDQQLSLHMSQKSGLGLADMLVQQLSQQKATAIPGQTTKKNIDDYSAIPVIRKVTLPPTSNVGTTSETEKVKPVDENISAISNNVNEAKTEVLPAFSGPVDFINRLWGMATEAASELGTQPAVLVAQAALETGWGKSIQKRQDGSSSFNLFNIKADARWDNDKVTVNTLEYRNGVAQKERADFRAYPSLQASFNDYVEFIKDSPRYHEALQKAADPQAYIEELHKAGYATDPDYTNKIKGILERTQFSELSGDLKLSQNETQI